VIRWLRNLFRRVDRIQIGGEYGCELSSRAKFQADPILERRLRAAREQVFIKDQPETLGEFPFVPEDAR
jgi:hypothetical protein